MRSTWWSVSLAVALLPVSYLAIVCVDLVGRGAGWWTRSTEPIPFYAPLDSYINNELPGAHALAELLMKVQQAGMRLQAR